MVTAIASIISYVALTLGAPCRQVFLDTALLERPSARAELPMLREFADVACQTDNPDLLWQLAFVESDFQFMLAAINHSGETSEVLRGDAAKKYLRHLRLSQQRVSVDIGVIQVNWLSHAKGFDNDPLVMVKPKNQVAYLIETLVPDLVTKCGKNWVGCYHSYANGSRARDYYRKVNASGRVLKKLATKVLELRRAEGSSRGHIRRVDDRVDGPSNFSGGR